MGIRANVRCGKYTFRTEMIIGVGDIFKASNGHVGIITGIGNGTHAEPTAKISSCLAKGDDAPVWIDQRPQRRQAYRRAMKQETVMRERKL